MKKVSKTEKRLKSKISYRREKLKELSKSLSQVQRLNRKAKVEVVVSKLGTEKGGYVTYKLLDTSKKQRGKVEKMTANKFYNHQIQKIKNTNKEINEYKHKLETRFNVHFKNKVEELDKESDNYTETDYHIWETKDLYKALLLNVKNKTINGIKVTEKTKQEIDTMINDLICETNMGNYDVFVYERDKKGNVRLSIRGEQEIEEDEEKISRLAWKQSKLPF